MYVQVLLHCMYAHLQWCACCVQHSTLSTLHTQGTRRDKDATSLDLIVMDNLFYGMRPARIYDLKGSERNRFNEAAAANPLVRTPSGATPLGMGKGLSYRQPVVPHIAIPCCPHPRMT